MYDWKHCDWALEYSYYEGIYIFITSVEIVLFSSEPNPYKLAFIYKMLIFYNFMAATCEITQVLIESNCI